MEWHLQDAYEAVNVYSDLAKDKHQLSDEKSKKKEPLTAQELETNRVAYRLKSLQRQVDIIKVYFEVGIAKILFLVFLCAIYVSDDVVDFESRFDNDTLLMFTKFMQTLAIIVLAIFILWKQCSSSRKVNNQIIKEKKTHKKIKSNLKNFTSKIVSFVRTSPLDFAMILIEPKFEKDYKIYNFNRDNQAAI